MRSPFGKRDVKHISQDKWFKLRLDIEQSPSVSNADKILAWKRYGCPVPPPSAYKQELVKAYARANRLQVLVETGTYFGDMVEATLNDFTAIYSIELSKLLYKKAVKKFKLHNKVNLLQGDSAQILPNILKKVEQPTLFWLDAHYSEGITAKGDTNTPILDELKAILKHPVRNHLILIDDAREFTGKSDYPTIVQIQDLVSEYWPKARVVVQNDVIRIQQSRQRIEI
jgi:hypothetical protein